MATNKMKYTYDFSRDTIGFLITSINDHTIWFAAKVLATKLLQKMQPNQCIVGTTAVVEICTEGFQMIWSHSLLNELLAYAVES